MSVRYAASILAAGDFAAEAHITYTITLSAFARHFRFERRYLKLLLLSCKF